MRKIEIVLNNRETAAYFNRIVIYVVGASVTTDKTTGTQPSAGTNGQTTAKMVTTAAMTTKMSTANQVTTEQSGSSVSMGTATMMTMTSTGSNSSTTESGMTTEHSNMTHVPDVTTSGHTNNPNVTMPTGGMSTHGSMTTTNKPTPKPTTQPTPTTTKKSKFQGGTFVGGIALGVGLTLIIAGIIYYVKRRGNTDYGRVN